MTDRRCPCHSRKRYRRCCQPLHSGRAAQTPLALMRSRYAAYAMGNVDYIMATTHPDGEHYQTDAAAWAESLRVFSAATRFKGLRILEHIDGEDEGWVTFRAELTQQGADVSFTENSRFEKSDGRWAYHSGAPASP